MRDLPQELTVKLEPGLAVGGTVQDPAGKPIANATVIINAPIKDEVGQILLQQIETVTSGADGTWRCTSIPRNVSGLNFSVSHPRFTRVEYDEAAPTEGLEHFVTTRDLRADKAVLTMTPCP